MLVACPSEGALATETMSWNSVRPCRKETFLFACSWERRRHSAFRKRLRPSIATIATVEVAPLAARSHAGSSGSRVVTGQGGDLFDWRDLVSDLREGVLSQVFTGLPGKAVQPCVNC